jgi:hypothetical protein
MFIFGVRMHAYILIIQLAKKKRCTRNAKFHILHFSNITIAILLDFDQTFTVHKVITLNIFALLFPLQNQYKQRDEAQY